MNSTLDYESSWIFNVKEEDGDVDIICLPANISHKASEFVSQQLSEEEIVDKVLGWSTAWAFIYYQAHTRRLFVGRDVFGRQSLVFCRRGTELTLARAVPQQRLKEEWHDVLYGQMSVIDLTSGSARIHCYLEKYPEDVDMTWMKSFDEVDVVVNHCKDQLVSVSRSIEAADEDFSTQLFQLLIKSCRTLLSGRCDLDLPNSVVALAFSGGVDSVLVAHAIQAAVSSHTCISLVNVAFGTDSKACSEAPDRARCLLAFEHLHKVYPSRKFKLILVDVNEDELKEQRTRHISRAACPANSVLDESLACVLWFAVRAQGRDYETGEQYSENCDSLFVGSGADELFAGYARHRNRFNKDGHAPIPEECEAELLRLGSRNGGRDDRVASSHKRSLLAPFLEEELVKWSNSLPLLAKADLSLARGHGEKKIIRKALDMLGASSDAPKQAMQFGSRVAKVANQGVKVKGSDKSDHLIHATNTSDTKK